jgi:TonB-linked SusC/RagA family outer membrane protein
MFKKLIIISVLLFGLFFLQMAHAQDITIMGVVKDDTGEGLIGATILVKNTGIGTVTNLDGEFRVNVNSKKDTLTFSSIGFVTQTVPLAGRSTLEIDMQNDILGLQEVVVTGYGEIRKSDLTSAISSLDTRSIKDLPLNNAAQAIQGRLAGVTVTQSSGAPGASTSIKIRGLGTINNSNPLFVLDGVIVDNIDFLSPNDIASIEVMKDASVAALYGARAANGVVVVQTKQGEAGEVVINYSSQVGVQNFWKEIDVMDSREFLIMSQQLVNGGRTGSWPDVFDTYNENLNNNDWIDLITQTGYFQQHSLSASGGTKDFKYRLSTRYDQNSGIIKNSDWERINVSGDFDMKLNKKSTLRFNAIVSQQGTNRQPTNRNGANSFSALREALKESPTSNLYNEEEFPGLNVLVNSPYSKVVNREDFVKKWVIQNKLFFNYELFQNLKFTSRFGFSTTFQENSKFEGTGNPSARLLTNQGLTTRVEKLGREDFRYSWDNLISYNKNFGENRISSTVAFTTEQKKYTQFVSEGSQALGDDSNTQYLQNTFDNYFVNGTGSKWTQMGFVGRVNYAYKAKYFMQLNGRYEGSSRFRADNRWGLFGGISGGWVITDENFFPKGKFLNELKLRGSWGQSGNNRIGDFASYTGLSSNRLVVYGLDQQPRPRDGYAATGIGNEGILWEKSTAYGAGFDAVFFDNLFLTVDGFIRDTDDMLLAVPVVPSIGFGTNPQRNAGSVRNKGLEVSLRYENKLGQVDVSFFGNMTYIQNEVTSVGESDEPILGADIGFNGGANGPNMGFITKTVVGRPIGSFYGFVLDDVNYPNGINPEDYQFAFRDLNQDGQITGADRTYIGNPLPNYTYGFGTQFSWKGIDLNLNFQGVFGLEYFNLMSYWLKGYNSTNALAGISEEFASLYPATSDNIPPELINKYSIESGYSLPIQLPSGARNASYETPSNFYIENGAFLRLKNLQIGYNLPQAITSFLHVANIKVFWSGQNLITWTNYSGYDPELGGLGSEDSEVGGGSLTNGVDFGTYPQARLYTLGINVGF